MRQNEEVEDLFYTRLLEIEGNDILLADDVEITMSMDFMESFIEESLRSGVRVEAKSYGYARYSKNGVISFRFTADYKLPKNTFVVCLK